jgi:NADPH-dependent ferric siderophore reductase
MTRPFPLHTGMAEVTAITAVTPAMARFTLTAPAFADFGIEEPGEIITLCWGDHWRNYTVRAYRPDRAEVDVDFFLHGDAGRAAAWAERARVGDRVGFAGPRLHWKGIDGHQWSLLVADETGVPALLAIAETLPPGHTAIAIAGADDPQHVETTVDLHWLPSGEIVEAVRGLTLPPGRGVIWGGGESGQMRKIRDHVRGPGRTLDVLGYWKR